MRNFQSLDAFKTIFNASLNDLYFKTKSTNLLNPFPFYAIMLGYSKKYQIFS